MGASCMSGWLVAYLNNWTGKEYHWALRSTLVSPKKPTFRMISLNQTTFPALLAGWPLYKSVGVRRTNGSEQVYNITGFARRRPDADDDGLYNADGSFSYSVGSKGKKFSYNTRILLFVAAKICNAAVILFLNDWWCDAGRWWRPSIVMYILRIIFNSIALP